MTTKIRTFARSAWFVTAVTIAVVLTTIAIGRYYELDRGAWASWVQAIGSIAAILVAVWVSWHQSEQQRLRDEEREQAELAGVLQCLLAEVETTLNSIGDIEHKLMEAKANEPFAYIFVLPDDPFPIFDSLIPRLGVIKDAALQSQIIHTFALAKAVSLTIKRHNHFVEAWSAAIDQNIKEGSAASASRLAFTRTDLMGYTGGMREHFFEGRTEMLNLRHALAPLCSEPRTNSHT